MNKLLSVVFTFFSFIVFAQKCDSVKTGTFFIENENYGGSLLIRSEVSQEEIIKKLSIHSTFDLVWIDDCNYALYNRTVLKGNHVFPEAKKTDSLFIEIIDVTQNQYTFKASSNFSDFVVTGVAKKITKD